MDRYKSFILPVSNCVHNSFKTIEVKYCRKYNTNTKTSVSFESKTIRVFFFIACYAIFVLTALSTIACIAITYNTAKS